MAYSKEDKAIIKALKAADVKLEGDETSEQLADLAAANQIKLDKEANDEVTERSEIEGVPEQLPPQMAQSANGKSKYPVFFAKTFKGKNFIYGPNGVRVSHGEHTPANIGSTIARFNQSIHNNHRFADR